MSSDASQSILRLTLLASATAAFMVVWTADDSRTVGMTLAERNRQIVPAHALTASSHRTQLAARRSHSPLAQPAVRRPQTTTTESRLNARQDVDALPAGSYRVVFEDGRVEWLTVIDRNGSAAASPAVLSTMVNGEPAHVIRVTSRPLMGTTR